MASVLEMLESADHYLAKPRGASMIERAVCRRLHEAVVLLAKGYPPQTDVEPLLRDGREVEDVPNARAELGRESQ